MLLSIITVNLNNAEGLERTARSIVEQTCQDYEWIVIDGGSTDGSVDIIKKYADHISYWVSEPDKGIYNAMNKGIEQAKGKYLNFMNSGDCFYDNEVIEKFKEVNPIELIYYGKHIEVIGEQFIREVNLKIESFSYIFAYGFNHQSFFIKRECFKDYIYNEDLKYASDYELFVKLLYKGVIFHSLNFFVAQYDKTGISSLSKKDLISEFILINHQIISPYILKDYKELFELRKFIKSDIGNCAYKIIHSNKFIRYITRIFLYPLSFISNFTRPK